MGYVPSKISSNSFTCTDCKRSFPLTEAFAGGGKKIFCVYCYGSIEEPAKIIPSKSFKNICTRRTGCEISSRHIVNGCGGSYEECVAAGNEKNFGGYPTFPLTDNLFAKQLGEAMVEKLDKDIMGSSSESSKSLSSTFSTMGKQTELTAEAVSKMAEKLGELASNNKTYILRGSELYAISEDEFKFKMRDEMVEAEPEDEPEPEVEPEPEEEKPKREDRQILI